MSWLYEKLSRFVGSGTYQNELELQNAVEKVLVALGVGFEREKRLVGDGGRIDFFCPSGGDLQRAGGRTSVRGGFESVGIELKIKGGATEVLRQLHRYACCPELDVVILVTTRAQHRHLAGEMKGKPVHVVWLGGGL